MPFITQDRRGIIAQSGLDGLNEIQPGDRCYVFYKEMVDEWKGKPGWTTAHKIYKEVVKEKKPYNTVDDKGVQKESGNIDDYLARTLAWQVFFQLYVMPYELLKKVENGDI